MQDSWCIFFFTIASINGHNVVSLLYRGVHGYLVRQSLFLCSLCASVYSVFFLFIYTHKARASNVYGIDYVGTICRIGMYYLKKIITLWNYLCKEFMWWNNVDEWIAMLCLPHHFYMLHLNNLILIYKLTMIQTDTSIIGNN